MNWSNYQTIEFHTTEGRFKLYLSGSHLRIEDMDESLKRDRIIWIKMYRIDVSACLKGKLSSFNNIFANILSECKTLEKAVNLIESKFIIE